MSRLVSLPVFLLLIFATVLGFGQVQVAVTNLTDGETIEQPYTIKATAQSPVTISGWKIYVDGLRRWQGSAFANNILATRVLHHLKPGDHTVTVRAWNFKGEYGTARLRFRVEHSVPPPERIHTYFPNPNLPFGNPNPARVLAVAEADDFNGQMDVHIDGDLKLETTTPFVDSSFNLSPGVHTLLLRYRTFDNAWILKSYQFCVRSGDPTQEGCVP